MNNEKLDMDAYRKTKLTKREKICIRLYYFESWTQIDIAEHLSISESGVQKMIYRIQRKLERAGLPKPIRYRDIDINSDARMLGSMDPQIIAQIV